MTDMTILILILAALAAILVPHGVSARRARRRPTGPVTLDEILGLARKQRGLFGVKWFRRQFALRLAGVPLNDVLIPENWPKLLLPGLRKIWHTRLRSREETFKAGELYTPGTSQRAFEEFQGIGEVGSDGWAEFEKTRKVPYGGFDPNYLAQLRHKTFVKGIMVERELLEDNLYPQAGIPASVNQRVEKLADSAAVFREKAAADVFNNAFTDSGKSAAGFDVSGPDGVGLVSTAHPYSPSNTGTTQSNEFTLALSGANVTTVRNAMRGWKDDKGDPVSIDPNILLVPPALGDTARTIVNTPLLPGGNNNDINPHAGRFTVIEWPYLTDTDAWFMIDKVLMDEHLIWLDRVKPEFTSEEDFDTIIAKYRGYHRFSTGWDAWQWIAGSNAS